MDFNKILVASTTMFGIKFYYNKEVRRVEVKDSISYEELRETASRIFRGQLPSDFLLKYLDDEDDLITCTSDEELHQAFVLFEDKRMLKMHIKFVEKRNLLDSLEEALTKFLKDNPATALWELIKAKVESPSTKEKVMEREIEEASEFKTQEQTPQISEIGEMDMSQSCTILEEILEEELREEVSGFGEEQKPLEDTESECDENCSSCSEDEVASLGSSFVSSSQFSEIAQYAEGSECFENQIPPMSEELPQETMNGSTTLLNEVPAPPCDSLLCSRLLSKLDQLEDMGFNNKEKNTEYLIKHNGDMLETVKSLLEHF